MNLIKKVKTILENKRRLAIFALVLVGLAGLLFWKLSTPAGAVPWAPTLADWGKRKQLTLVNNSGSTLPANTPYQLSIDTQSLAAIPKDVLETCDDLHIVYQPNSTTAVDVARSFTLVSTATNCTNSSTTTFTFPLQAAITNGSSDTSYYLYYSNHLAASYSATTALSSYDTTPGAAGFVAPFNGTTTAVAASGSGVPTTATGAIRYQGLKSGFLLNGGSVHGGAVTVTNWQQTIPTAFTMEAWVYIFSLNSAYSGNGFQIMEDTFSDGTAYRISLTGGTINGRIGGQQVTSSTNGTSNTWTHIAMTYDGSAIRLFKDGTLIGTNSSPGALGAPTSPLSIGGRGTNNQNWPGIVDEVRISTVARYTANFTPQTTPFVRDDATRVLIHFDEAGDDPRNTGKAFDDSTSQRTVTLPGIKMYAAGAVGVDDAAGTISGQLNSQAYGSHKGTIIEQGTTNLILDPSFENATVGTNWTASAGGTLAQDGAPPHAKFGTFGGRLKADLFNRSAITTVNVGDTNTYVLSAFVYDNTSGNVGGNVTSSIADLQVNSATASATYTDVGGGWWRLTSSSFTGVNANEGFGVEALAGKTIFVDGVQLEQKSVATTFADGSMGTGYAWTGTVNSSTSTRTAANLQYAIASNIVAAAGSLSVWVRTPWAGNDGVAHTILDTDTTAGTLKISKDASNNITISDGSSSATKAVSWAANSWNHIVATWGSNSVSIYVNNVAGTTETPFSAPTLGTNFYVGQDKTNANLWDGTVSDLRIYDSVLTSGQVANLYNASRGSHKESVSTNRFTGPEDPVAYWKFDEGTGTTAFNSAPNYPTPLTANSLPISSRSLDATISGIPATVNWQPSDLCVSANCLRFDGASNFVSPTATIAGVQTVAFWARPASSSGTIPFMDLTRKPTGINISSSSLAVTTSGITSPTVYVNGKVGTTLVANQWNYVEVTTATAFKANNPVIGRVGNTYFMGTMDEVKFYGYARSVAQVQTDYNSKNAASNRGASAVMGASSSEALSEGLVGYWKMDEATWSGTLAEVVDSSGNSNNGQAAGATGGKAYPSIGKFGNGGLFDGVDDYVNLGSSSLVSGVDNSTVTAWVKLTSIKQGVIYGEEDSVGTRYALYIDGSGLANFGANVSGTWYWATSATALVTGRWYHLVGTFSTTSGEVIYVDGVQAGTNANRTKQNFTINRVSIGQNVNFSSSSSFAGSVDDLRIYNRMLSPVEVRQLYNFAPGPVGYWNFEEGIGTSVADRSGSGNTGAWTGAGDHWTQGKFGKAGKFDGATDVVTVGNPASLQFNAGTSWTIGAWVRVPTSENNAMITGYHLNGTTSNIQLRVNNSGGSDAYGYIYLRDDNAGVNDDLLGTKVINDNAWHYLTYVRDVQADLIRLYVDGVADGTAADTSSVGFTDASWNIGAIFVDTDYTDFTNGQIDELRIYNYARTPGQIVSDMNGGHPLGGSPVGSTADYWKFDNGFGLAATSSGIQHTVGTLTNMAVPVPSVGISGWQKGGKFGGALAFDGTDDYVDFGDLSYTESTGTMSASLWVRPNALATQKCLLCKWNDTAGAASRSWAIETGGSNANAISVEISTDGNTGIASGETAAGMLSVGTWTHVTVVYDSNQIGNANVLKVFVNGLQRSLTFSGTVPSSTQANSRNARAGGSSDATAARMFSGMIDEVKIYSGALTSSEVLIDYNHGSSVVLGSFSDTSGLAGGSVASNSASALYCVPGDTTACAAPVGEWNFEEGSGGMVNDSSGNSNNGTWFGAGKVHWAAGKVGKAGNFDGATDRVALGTTGISATAGTVTVWVKPSAILSAETKIVMANTNVSGSNRIYMLRLGTTGNFAVRFGSSANVDTGIALAVGQWYHLAMTWNSGTYFAYINGKQVATGAYAGLSTIGTCASIGTYNNCPSSPDPIAFPGLIDQVRIYNYARSVAQVAWEYNRGLPMGQWKMDECTGTTLKDSISATNSATLTIGTAGNVQTSAGTCTDGLSTSAWYNGASGKFNYSVNFDGEDDTAAVTTGLNRVQAVSFWAKPASSSGTIPFITLATAPAINVSSSNLTVSATGWSSPTIYVNGKVSGTLTASAWNHIVVTSATSLSANAITFAFVSPTYFKGQLDDIRIFNYPITAAQMKLLYNQGAAVRFGPGTGAP